VFIWLNGSRNVELQGLVNLENLGAEFAPVPFFIAGSSKGGREQGDTFPLPAMDAKSSMALADAAARVRKAEHELTSLRTDVNKTVEWIFTEEGQTSPWMHGSVIRELQRRVQRARIPNLDGALDEALKEYCERTMTDEVREMIDRLKNNTQRIVRTSMRLVQIADALPRTMRTWAKKLLDLARYTRGDDDEIQWSELPAPHFRSSEEKLRNALREVQERRLMLQDEIEKLPHSTQRTRCVEAMTSLLMPIDRTMSDR
jgi:hypothetical protein